MSNGDETVRLAELVRAAAADGRSLSPTGGGSKPFLGRAVDCEALPMSQHRGIVSYAPTELSLSVRSGTPLVELESALSEQGQMLPFEPPHFGDGATVGGTIAAGLSGPARPYAGAARDFVLGTRVLNGLGEPLRFGGEVMKNVAGYDVSRLMTGAMGTLGVLLEVSMKVLPAPSTRATVVLEASAADAVKQMNLLAGRPLPISATAHFDNRLYVRLSGSETGVRSACARIGGEQLADAERFWLDLREHRTPFFASAPMLWRLSVPSTAPPLALPGVSLIEWGGAQRWLCTDADVDSIRSVTAAAGGHATAFRGGDRSGEVFHPLETTVMQLHRRLKRAFDPKGVLNPGRMYPDY